MIQAADPVTFTIPRDVLSDIAKLSDDLTDRMHELLERNTDGNLTAHEQSEIETLVRMAQFGQIVSLALARIDSLTGELVPLFHPLQQRWTEHFELQADGRSVGRTPTGRSTVVALQMNDPLPRIARALQYRLGLID